MAVLNKTKALTTLRKTPVILGALLQDVSQEVAQSSTDGPDGWSVVEIICHVRDFEKIFCDRIELALAQDRPKFAIVDHLRLVEENDYAHQNLRAVLTELHERRQHTLTLLESLSDEQLARVGIHPEQGEGTVMEYFINIGLHEINHLEQTVKALRSNF
jgi:hypothetical protein